MPGEKLPEPIVDPVLPKLPPPKKSLQSCVQAGLARFTWFITLNISARNCTFTGKSLIGNFVFLITDRSTSEYPGPKMLLRDSVPQVFAAGSAYAFGLNHWTNLLPLTV